MKEKQASTEDDFHFDPVSGKESWLSHTLPAGGWVGSVPFGAAANENCKCCCDMEILKNSRYFRPRRAVGFDREGGAIESNCPSGSKLS